MDTGNGIKTKKEPATALNLKELTKMKSVSNPYPTEIYIQNYIHYNKYNHKLPHS